LDIESLRYSRPRSPVHISSSIDSIGFLTHLLSHGPEELNTVLEDGHGLRIGLFENFRGRKIARGVQPPDPVSGGAV
jgi:hypothetical protein